MDGVRVDGEVNDLAVYASVDHNEIYNGADAKISSYSYAAGSNAGVDLQATSGGFVSAGVSGDWGYGAGPGTPPVYFDGYGLNGGGSTAEDRLIVSDLEFGASVGHNVIDNKGVIEGDSNGNESRGISLVAGAGTGVTAYAIQDSYAYDTEDGSTALPDPNNLWVDVHDIDVFASIESNTITNSGYVFGLEEGIQLEARSEVGVVSAVGESTTDVESGAYVRWSDRVTTSIDDVRSYAGVTNNKITNEIGGRVVGDYDSAIGIRAVAEVDDLTAVASIDRDELFGGERSYSAFLGRWGSANAVAEITEIGSQALLSNNELVNEGVLISGVTPDKGQDGFDLEAYASVSDIRAFAVGSYGDTEAVYARIDGVEASSEISNNIIQNSGSIYLNDNGSGDGVSIDASSFVGNITCGHDAPPEVWVMAGFGGDAYSYADAVTSNISAYSVISDNIVINEGLIDGTKTYSSDAQGFELEASSEVYASAGGYAGEYGTATANVTNVWADAIITNNTLLNSGDIKVSGDFSEGISLDTNARTYLDAIISSDHSYTSMYATINGMTGEAGSFASTSSNSIINSGTIASNGNESTGIEVDADAETYAYAFVEGHSSNYGVVGDARMSNVYARAQVNDNYVLNSGTITTYSEYGAPGIRLDADAKIEGWANTGYDNLDFDDGNAYATVENSGASAVTNDNTIINTGSIHTSGYDAAGITVTAIVEADFWAEADNDSNANEDGAEANIRDVYAFAEVSDNLIVNNGVIETNGAQSSAIELASLSDMYAGTYTYARDDGYANSYIDNAGAVATLDNNTVTNTGSIETRGYSEDSSTASHGISLTATSYAEWDADAYVWSVGEDYSKVTGGYSSATISNNTVTNTGSIATFAAYSNGINVVSYADIDLRSSDDEQINDAWGTVVDNTIVNSGQIVVLGHDADGIFVDGSYEQGTSSIDPLNSGTSPETSWYAVRGNTINNSGKIVAAYGHAIHVNGTTNTFNFEAPAFFGGGLYLGGLNTEDDSYRAQVNITTGPSHSVTWHITGYLGEDDQNRLNVSGGIPYAVSHDYGDRTTFATFDPTGVSAAPNVISDMTGAISDMAENQYRKYGSNRAWISFTQGANKYDGNGQTTLDHRTDNRAVAVGLSGDLTEGFTVRGLAGYGWNGADASSRWSKSIDNEAQGFFGGVFAKFTAGIMDLSVGVLGGQLNHNDKRHVNDNLVDNGSATGAYQGTGNGDATLGNASTKADYDSWWFAPEASLAINFQASENTILRPYAKARYVNQSIDARSETTSDLHVSSAFGDRDAIETAWIGSQDVEMLIVDAGMDFQYQVGGMLARIGGGYQFRENWGDDAIEGELLGQSVSIPVDVTGASSPYAAAALQYQTGIWNIGANGRVNFLDGEIGYQVGGIVQAKF